MAMAGAFRRYGDVMVMTTVVMEVMRMSNTALPRSMVTIVRRIITSK